MSSKILFVDDEQNVLNSFRTTLGRRYDVHTALGPGEALAKITAEGPFKVVVADLKMPGMDGVSLLSRISQMAPSTVRVMLTGYADLESAMSAVNQGHVFRFLTKPCSTETMIVALDAAIEQHRLITLEKEMLRSTLWGAIKMLTEILSLVNPEAFGRSERVKRLVKGMARELGLPNQLKYELAAMLSQIGCVSVPEDILSKKYAGLPLSAEEEQIYELNIPVAVGLLGNIPRLEEVSQIVACQSPGDCNAAEASIGGRILRLALDYDDLDQRKLPMDEALSRLGASMGLYGEAVLSALQKTLLGKDDLSVVKVMSHELEPGMILAEDVRTHEGSLMLARGLEMSRYMIERLGSIALSRSIREPLLVYVARPESAAGS
jgi:response regulator RpfG family c-di-GMP phosphodiesterase